MISIWFDDKFLDYVRVRPCAATLRLTVDNIDIILGVDTIPSNYRRSLHLNHNSESIPIEADSVTISR